MTNEQKVRVDRLERYLISDRDKIYTRVRVNDLDTVLSLIKEQQKQIDLMAEYWNNGLAMCDNCEKIVENYDKNKCKDCIKQYFARKVEDVKD